jgi:tRNA(His) 5'-end guanylyltransferase
MGRIPCLISIFRIQTLFVIKFNKYVFLLKNFNEKFKKKIESIDYKTINIYKNHLDGSFTNFEILRSLPINQEHMKKFVNYRQVTKETLVNVLKNHCYWWLRLLVTGNLF